LLWLTINTKLSMPIQRYKTRNLLDL
jgi:hypothetical protein